METKNHSLAVQEELDFLNADFQNLFRPSSVGRYWLIPSINRNIEAYGIVDIDAWDVLSEAYIRAVKFISNGGTIWNLISWFKSASVIIIHEHRRKFYRFDTISTLRIDLVSTWEFTATIEVLDIDILGIVDRLYFSLKYLSQMERDLLFWRVENEFSWKQIREILIQRGDCPPSLEALRQKKQRALKKLKRAFLATGAKTYGLSEKQFEFLCQRFKDLNNFSESIK